MSVKSTVSAQRNIQQQVERADARHGDGESGAMQAGARRYPEPPFPRQHQAKPGDEARLDPPPMYEAPYYRGSRKLED